MRKLLFIITLVMSAVIVNAQKITVNEVDEFTGDAHIETDFELIWTGSMGSPSVGLGWSVWNGVPIMRAWHVGRSLCSVDEGESKFYFIFTDGSKLVLDCSKDQTADYNAAGNVYYLFGQYQLTKEEIKTLQTKVISKFRMDCDGIGYEQGEVKTKRAQKVREMFKLLDVDTMLK